MAEKKQPAPLDDIGAQVQAILSQVTVGSQTRVPTLGPPQEYFTPERGAPEGFKAFVDGDQWQPAARDKGERAQLQAVMNSLGLFGDDGYTPGVWDQKSAAAYQNVLEFANAAFIPDPNVALRMYADEYQAKGGQPKQSRAPLTVRYEDPNAVRAVVRDSAFKLLGRRLNAADEDRLISTYQSQLASYQQALYQAEEGGGSVTAPDLGSMVNATIENQNAPEVATQRYLSGFEKIVSSLGPVVSRPSLSAGGGVS